MKLRILEPLGIPESTLQHLLASYTEPGDDVRVRQARPASDDEILAFAGDAEAILLANMPLSASVLEKMPALRYVGIAFTGYDHVGLEGLRGRSVTVSNCAGYATDAVAELVIGMVLAMLRDLAEADRRTRAGETRQGLRQQELKGRRFGIIGYGTIGRAVARLAEAFGCEVLVNHHRPLPDREVIGRQVDRETLLRSADIISLHVPLNDETRGMIDADALALMGPETVLVNTARGPVVDRDALHRALEDGAIRYACLDVFDHEPPLPDDEPLLEAPHTLLTPHIGFATEEALEDRARLTFENFRAWREGSPRDVVYRGDAAEDDAGQDGADRDSVAQDGAAPAPTDSSDRAEDPRLADYAALIEGDGASPLALLANTAAWFMETWESLNWAGFYLFDREGTALKLGPFTGRPACRVIPTGDGICGRAATADTAIIVDDVEADPAHIVCDSRSQSEMVVPFHVPGADGEVVRYGVLDLDAPVKGRFTAEDQALAEAVLETLAAAIAPVTQGELKI